MRKSSAALKKKINSFQNLREQMFQRQMSNVDPKKVGTIQSGQSVHFSVLCHTNWCSMFRWLPVKEKWDRVSHLNICFRCLGTDHARNTCISSIVSKHCNADQHTLLHIEGIVPIDAEKFEYSKEENSSIRLEDSIINEKIVLLRVITLNLGEIWLGKIF